MINLVAAVLTGLFSSDLTSVKVFERGEGGYVGMRIPAILLVPDPQPHLLAGRNPPLATDNLLENTDGGSKHAIRVLSGRQPAAFYLC